ncbi:YjhX family toxin [Seohaeicola zhoushanensis]
MNISKHEQRVLHELALGGAIHFERRENGKIHSVTCYTREGHILGECTLDLFHRLHRRGSSSRATAGPTGPRGLASPRFGLS